MKDLSMSDECLSKFINMIHQLTGITIVKERKDMLIGRLNKRVRATEAVSYSDYFSLLSTSVDEKLSFIDAITTNETTFFRTPQVWEFIEKQFLPEFYAKHPNQKLRAWSAAASSGEEAVSLGMSFLDFKKRVDKFEFEITGTDISPAMIAKCQQGHYQGRTICKLQEQHPCKISANMKLVRDDVYEPIPEIKTRLSFHLHNLFENFKQASTKFHLVLLRNVMIYFNREDQKRVLDNICHNLAEGGILIIGESESIVRLTNDFEYICPRIYRLKGESVHA